MWNVLEPWQIQALQRLATLEPDRLETILNTLWQSYPGLFEELAVMAAERDALSSTRCAEVLGIPVEEVQGRIAALNQREDLAERLVVMDDEKHVAKFEEAQVTVWEIVRTYRRLGSVERLEGAFPSLTRGQIAAALKYAQAHPEEIEAQIARYEETTTRRQPDFRLAG